MENMHSDVMGGKGRPGFILSHKLPLLTPQYHPS